MGGMKKEGNPMATTAPCEPGTPGFTGKEPGNIQPVARCIVMSGGPINPNPPPDFV